ncbi:MAG TPA: bifunctional UDP-N-acetylmuramoyl-tripeptide:D-alanyl-D-alanine ligase/alanine racemase [Flavisolibacter sp.]|jgi:alanine racemase|nr:bifunctional UDP-N-acetylmuramoyl-tripeptide:D-alanyl-D-alanine ligase/alanine racemase [Flavisolibacter sp.]
MTKNNMAYFIQTICSVVKGEFLTQYSDDKIENLVYDSRRILQPASSLFFAIKTEYNDGHKYLSGAYKRGVRNFIVNKHPKDKLAGSNIILVESSLAALQELASFHRDHFSFPVIGITGSNGKTIVKEWLNHLLEEDYKTVRSPKSFNSQIGVPLSVWQMNEQHTLAIFEAGISNPGEMELLENIIQPTIGVLTNIGEAHSEGFLDNSHKLAEKLLLFKNCPLLIARNKDIGGKKELVEKDTTLLTWGSAESNAFVLSAVEKQKDKTGITLTYQSSANTFLVPFVDDASVENAITCCCVLLTLGYKAEVIKERIAKLHAIDMRLQLKHGINDTLLINDSYSADVTSLKIALDFLKQQSSGLKRTVILSEFVQSGQPDEELYAAIATLLNNYEIKKVVAIGERVIEQLRKSLSPSIRLLDYASTEDFVNDFKSSQFFREIVLIKGARKFEFERIAKLFEKKMHQTVLQIDLNALAHNVKEYQKLLQPSTKIMAMVKAFSYGSGGAEIASVLQFHNVDYLGLAYADEGVELVKAGINLPIMVMNAEESSFQSIVDYNLQPVIYSFNLLQKFEDYLKEQGVKSFPVHLEVETGMNRLGFLLDAVEELAEHFASSPLQIQSVFSHLAASEDPSQDDFTNQQAELFNRAIQIIQRYVNYPFLKHISNSAAIVRHPQLQMDMVRLGIGLYGIEIDNDNLLELTPVATLRSTIAQLKHLKKGETVSYNRRGIVDRDSVIATVRIGYADGYSRQFGNGVGKMLVNGRQAPVIGTVCMDMTMIDVTDINGVKEGDEVIIFGSGLPVQDIAKWINTIPYEVMTSISQRVKRIYFHE